MVRSASENVLTKRALREQLPEGGVLVLESHHAPDFVMEWRSHSFVKVVYALTGTGRVEIRESAHVFQSRDVILVPPRHRNRIVDDPGAPASLYVFCISTKLLQFDSSLTSRLRPGRLRRSRHFATQAERRLRRLLYLQNEPGEWTSLKMVSDAMQFLELVLAQPVARTDSQSSRGDADRDEMLAYIEYLDTHFFDARTIEEAAKRVGIERRRFTHLFRQVTKMSWLEYVRRLSVRHAEQLLSTTTLPITSVAFECGFEDLSTFYRRFKSANGISPGEWRKANS